MFRSMKLGTVVLRMLLRPAAVCLAIAAHVAGCCCVSDGPRSQPKPAELVGKYVGVLRASYTSEDEYAAPGPVSIELKEDGACSVQTFYDGGQSPRFFSGQGTWQVKSDGSGRWLVVMAFPKTSSDRMSVLRAVAISGHGRPYHLVNEFPDPDHNDSVVYTLQE